MRTTDPFLNDHVTGSYVFDIGGRLWPISIRDQMVRGRLIIERALEQRSLIHQDRPVAVIGAGAAGVTAALYAANQGVPVTLFERDRLFARHALCRTRWVHPTQYDWPVSHWDAGCFPWSATPAMPLTWHHADFAYDLALEWEIQFMRQYSRLAHLLTVRMPTTVTNVTPAVDAAHLARVDWTGPTGVGHANFGMVVRAVGFGEEKCYVSPAHAYRGFEFWANDPFALSNLGCPAPPNVLISGSGDGGLQDFLRIVTRCNSALEIWNHLSITARQILTDVRCGRSVPAGVCSRARCPF